jgi:hypothetical protein
MTLNGKNARCTVEDGRPQGAMLFTRRESSWEDGRPQGATHHPRTTPVPTMYGPGSLRRIVGTGEGLWWGGAPCGRPSSSEVSFCGRPSPSSMHAILTSLSTGVSG